LAPSDTAQIDQELVRAFATEVGGRTSHTAIMARSMEIPAVVGVTDILSEVETGTTVVVDGLAGEVIVDPTKEELIDYERQIEEYQARKERLAELKELPAETTDGHRVELVANIGTPADVEGALANGAEGIGLYRSEFLYMDRDSLPTEEEQFKSYKEVAQKIDGPIVIRTMDIGGDKELPYLDMPEEMNPFLGYRAIRMSLDKPEIFKVQLRAILRASAYGEVKIMYPMISAVEQLREANEILAEVKAELREEDIDFDGDLEVGMMIEVPAAAMIADVLAQETDFFSIGTNDLIQYTTATDRMNEQIADLYQPFHPAILRLIKRVVEAAHEAGNWAGMCGEMAGDKRLAPFLLGVGLDEFSMSAVSIPEVKDQIRNLSRKEAQEIAGEALSYSTAREVENFLSE
ncbi:MAG: phosphoenolpyruvate--protein phosphotransferase, partial [Bacillota bacterium]